MFDFAWTEIALIGVVALVAIGPKDLPVAIKAVAGMVKKARRMAGEFQTHVDEMVREANLDEVRSQISQFRNLDLKGTIERAVDGDGSIRRTFNEDPMNPSAAPVATTETVAQAVTESPVAGVATAADFGVQGDIGAASRRSMERPSWLDSKPGDGVAMAEAQAAPAFIPPSIASPPVPPAFIPPGIGPSGGSRPAA